MLFPRLSSCSMYCWIYRRVRRGTQMRERVMTYDLCEDSLQEDLHHERRVGEDCLHNLRFLSNSRANLAEQLMESCFVSGRAGIGLWKCSPSVFDRVSTTLFQIYLATYNPSSICPISRTRLMKKSC